MSPSEFSTIARNKSIQVPMFRVRPNAEKTGDAKKAFPGDKFITFWDGQVDRDSKDFAVGFHRLNSRNKIETNEDGERLDGWHMKISQVQYCGEVSLPFSTWNEDW